MPFFSRFKNKAAPAVSRPQTDGDAGRPAAQQRARYQSSWNSPTIVPEEVEELIHACTLEMKSRAEALDAPFLLLPFRPDTDASSARLFIRNFFRANAEGSSQYRGVGLQQELRLTEPVALCSIIKWCWSRMPAGVVTWPVYEGFQIGEKEADMARNAFDTFIPITAESTARKNIIFDFFDLLAAVAAHGKLNGLGGRKLSRLAGWWAFDHSDDGKGFEGGYNSWTAAADASSHLFFAYLRSLSPEADPQLSVIERIPRSLQALLASTEYPPETPTLLQRSTPRVLMLVDAVSPTPFALIRRAKHFEYRDNDRVLREYSEYEDPIDALTEESKRVLFAVSSTNMSAAQSRQRTLAKPDQFWSSFEDAGFADMSSEKTLPKLSDGMSRSIASPTTDGLRSQPRSRNTDHGRPTTPSWAEFLTSGFEEGDINGTPRPFILGPGHSLPPISSTKLSPHLDAGEDLAPGEVAAITNVELDDAFWWVWMTSLASEEPSARKAVFGRCALIETNIMNGKWLIMEEQLKGASPDPVEGAYVAPKKGFLSTLAKRSKLGRKRSTIKQQQNPSSPPERVDRAASATPSKSSLAPDQHSKIKQAAAALARRQSSPEDEATPPRRGRIDDPQSSKTNSMLTIGLQSEAVPALKWTSAYDKNAIRAQYLGDVYAGRGFSREDILLSKASSVNLGDGTKSAPPITPTTTTTAAAAAAATSSSSSTDQLPGASPAPQEPTPENEAVATVSSEAPVAPTEPTGALEKELGMTQPTPTGPEDHPAHRHQQAALNDATISTPQSPTTTESNAAAIAAVRAMQNGENVSPGMTASARNAAKKQESSSGVKKLFGRRNKNPPASASQEGTNGSLAPPSDTIRRPSFRNKKSSQNQTQTQYESQSPAVKAAQMAGGRGIPDAASTVPVAMPPEHYGPSTFDVSPVDKHEREDAEREFARFDQNGEVSDISEQAATPDDFHTPLSMPQAQRPAYPSETQPYATEPVRHEPETKHYAPAETRYVPSANHERSFEPSEAGEVADDAHSEMTMDNTPSFTSPGDRWAAIRANAARRAARESEEQSVHSRPSQSARTDDGETSGEETIESRVARIKARVAELTGGMDSHSARR